MGKLHSAEPFCTCRDWRGAFPGRDLRSCSPRENVKLLFERKFRTIALCFFEEFCRTILLTVSARSKLGQGVSCLCPEIFSNGDDHSSLFLYGQLVDGLAEVGWEKGSIIEACKIEFHSFVQEQPQLEHHSTTKRLDVGNILAYFSQQTGFQSCRYLFRVGSVLLGDANHCNQ